MLIVSVQMTHDIMHFIILCAHNTTWFMSPHICSNHHHLTNESNKYPINKFGCTIKLTDRGNVGVVLFNFGQEDFNVAIGDRIAQLILEQISMVPAVQVEELTETERGAGGFGSTGVAEGSAEKKARTISPTADGVQKME